MISHSITYYCNGGLNAITNPEAYAEGDVITFQAPTKAGYVFDGWYKEAAFKNKITNTAGCKINITLYAKWKPIEYSITYRLMDTSPAQTGASNHAKNAASYNVTKQVILQNPTRAGYTFAGWFYDSKATGKKVTKIPKGTTGNITLYANWIENVYTVSYNANGGKFNTKPAKNTYKYSQSFQTEAASIVEKRMGYTFLGWNTNKKGGENTRIKAGTSTSKLQPKNKASKVLYAEWYVNQYPIKYVLNGGSQPVDKNGKSLNPATHTYIKTTALKNPVRKGYTFGGWYYTSDFSGKKVTTLPSKSEETFTIYAKWTANPYTIKFNANGGKGTMKAVKATYDQTVTLPEITFTKTSKGKTYTFAGWNTKKDGTGVTYTNKASVKNLMDKKNGIVTLYAQWK